jgi:hypothetical protein
MKHVMRAHDHVVHAVRDCHSRENHNHDCADHGKPSRRTLYYSDRFFHFLYSLCFKNETVTNNPADECDFPRGMLKTVSGKAKCMLVAPEGALRIGQKTSGEE